MPELICVHIRLVVEAISLRRGVLAVRLIIQ